MTKKKSSKSAINKAIINIMRWANREEWRAEKELVFEEHVAPVCADFEITPDELARKLGEQANILLLDFALEDLVSRCFPPDNRNVIDDYLKKRGRLEPVVARQYLQALRNSFVSLYEVVQVEPGSYVVLRDLIRGGEVVRAEERLGSQAMVQWDKLAARVVTLMGRNYLTGATFLLPSEAAESLLRIFRDTDKQMQQTHKKLARRRALEEDQRQEVSTVVLAGFATGFSRVWLMYCLDSLQRPLPELTNFDGEKIVLSVVTFPLLEIALSEVEHLLDAAPELERESDERSWTWLAEGDGGKPPRSKARGGLSFLTFRDDNRTLLGSVDLHEKHVILSVDSKERAERGKALLLKLLAGFVGTPLTSVQSVEQALEEWDAQDNDDDEFPEAEEIDREIVAPILKEFLDDHYRNLLEEKVPALDKKTPRQLVRSAAGKKKVVVWLKNLENHEARRTKGSKQQPYDFSWMWEELGIAELRR
ncbi:MAG: hypothetical protein HYY96_11660 [Candidatus Tectomicrobia bacterium]|nr:hypothetical protein [Candidatus Tectomicrobia bacterium]